MPEKEILVVASKLKAFIKDDHELNTAGNVLPHLSELVRKLCFEAAQNAKSDGRKTLMDRDFREL